MKKQTKSILYKALLLDGGMAFALYKHELEEHISYWKEGLKKDEEEFVFVVTENNGDVAMLLINNNDELYINENARDQLKILWKKTYNDNMVKLLPHMAEQITNNIISVNGVKYLI